MNNYSLNTLGISWPTLGNSGFSDYIQPLKKRQPKSPLDPMWPGLVPTPTTDDTMESLDFEKFIKDLQKARKVDKKSKPEKKALPTPQLADPLPTTEEPTQQVYILSFRYENPPGVFAPNRFVAACATQDAAEGIRNRIKGFMGPAVELTDFNIGGPFTIVQ